MGDGFGATPQVEAKIEGSKSGWQKLPTLQTSDTNVKFVIPKVWPKSAYVCRVSNQGQPSAETVLNGAECWWIQGDLGNGRSSPGSKIRVFGKCLNFGGKGQIRLQAKGKPALNLVADETTPFALGASLPATVTQGTYAVALNNGTGGANFWNEVGTVEVVPAPAWKTDVFNVADFRAKAANDTEAIKAALAQAGTNGGGIVYLPRGNYSLTETLEIPRHVTLRGVSEALVNLQWPDSQTPLPALIHGTDNFAVENLCLYVNNHMDGIEGNRGYEATSGNIRIHNVRIRMDRYLGVTQRAFGNTAWKTEARRREDEDGRVAAISMGGDNIEISDCDIYISATFDFNSTKSLILDRIHGGRITNNRIYGAYRNTCIIRGVEGLVFEGNDMQGGIFIGTHHTHTGRFGDGGTLINTRCENVYFANNKIHDNIWWDRELVSFDSQGPMGVYLGRVTAANGKRITLEKAPDPAPSWDKSWKGAAVYILDGKGAGQYRRVVGGSGADVELDRPWDVAPDATSRISIAKFHGRVLLVNNTFTDGGNVMWWGGGIDCVMANNTAKRIGAVLTITGWIYDGLMPNWYCQFLDNTLQEGGGSWGGPSKFGTVTEKYPLVNPLYDGPVSRCGIHRRDRSENGATIDVSGGSQDVLVENCHLAEADNGITVTTRGTAQPSGVVLRHNQFVNVTQSYSGPALNQALIVP